MELSLLTGAQIFLTIYDPRYAKINNNINSYKEAPPKLI